MDTQALSEKLSKKYNYTYPVSSLLTLGRPQNEEWVNYLACGLKQDHIPELIRMMMDYYLMLADGDSVEVWSPIHAWRSLGQLKAVEAVEPMIAMLLGEEEGDELKDRDFPKVFGLIGPSALAALSDVSFSGRDIHAKLVSNDGIRDIANLYPEARKECINIIMDQLRQYQYNDAGFNGYIIWVLIELKALESLDLIREVYKSACVDVKVVGHLSEVERDIGCGKSVQHNLSLLK